MVVTMINPATFTAEGATWEDGSEPGSVEVKLDGEARRVHCFRNTLGIHVQGITGRIKGGRKRRNIRLSLRPNGHEHIAVWDDSGSRLDGKAWEAFAFGAVIA